MSLLERLGRGHLDDRQFARLWTTGGGDPHLDACALCRTRFEEFDRWVLSLGEDLRAEAEGAFSAERLAAQQAHIAHRLEALERPARVIAFPKAARAVISGHSHVRRWVTAAAAAGLIAGIGLGQLLDLRHVVEQPLRQGSAARLAGPTNPRSGGIRPASLSASDEELLIDSEALARPRVEALSAIDELTPRARDLVDPR